MKIAEYFSLTKFGLVAGNLITVIAAFALGSEGSPIDFVRLAAVTAGMALVMASGCVFNNIIDRDIDARMARTQDRALVASRLSLRGATIFGGVVGACGLLALAYGTNALTAAVALGGFFLYVVAYSMWAKRRTVYGTAVGALAGAVPPLAGYAAAAGRLDVAALFLFLILVAWQMPHFFSIAIRRGADYAAAGVPAMPLVYGTARAKVSMLVYIAEFTGAAALLVPFHYEGRWYLAAALALGGVWFALGIAGLFTKDAAADRAWATRMFVCSLIAMTGLFVAMTLGAVV